VLTFIENMFRRLVAALWRPPSPAESVVPLLKGVPASINFDGFTKGIDNIHIDVHLSPQFVSHAARLITSLMESHAARGRLSQKSPGPTSSDWDQFRTSYARMVETAVHHAKVAGSVALVQLVQFAAMKFLLQQVQVELDLLRQGLKGPTSSGGSATDSHKLELNERMSWFARNRARVRYKTNHQLFEQLFKVESGPLGDLRQSLLGDRWSVPLEVFFNPLLQAETILDDELMMTHYVLLGQDDAYSFPAIDSFLSYLFRRRTPTDQTEIALTQAEQAHGQLVCELDRFRKKRTRAIRRTTVAELEKREAELKSEINKANAELERIRVDYLKAHYAWADTPVNVDTLFDSVLYAEHVRTAQKEKDKEGVSRLKAQLKFQRRLLSIVEQRFFEAGLLTPVIAAYEMLPLHRDYSQIFNAQQLHQFLCGNISRKEILLKLKEMRYVTDKALPVEQLNGAALQMARLSGGHRREYLVRFLKDFVTFRRDHNHYYLAHDAMNSIHLLEDPRSVRLSHTNNTLYEFLASNEEEAVAQTILNHVILKADVRGSTTMVAELRKRGLNPASHFSLNLFEPINVLLETYGASKVFVEGDAVILSLCEYQDQGHRLSVARACGLAKRLLSVIYAQNSLCKKGGLPELELGFGLVFSDEAPTFLYDGDTRIMISSAIGRADRLSSCSWLLRKQRSQRSDTYTNVEIYEIPEGDPLRGEKGEIHLRYNVNGIELDAAGFVKLRSEITLQKLELLLPGDDGPTTLYTGRYPDLKGTMQRLVIREGRIRLLNMQDPDFGKPTTNTFYEVVTNEALLNKVEEAIKTGGSGGG